MHKLIHISSKDRIPNSTDDNANFKVSFGNLTALQGVKKLVLKQASFINIFYNINQYNSIFSYTIGGTPTIIALPKGQYSIDTLITTLESAGSSIGLSITLSPLTKRLTFTTTTAIKYISDVSLNPMAEVLGIISDSVGDVLTYSADGAVDLGGEKHVHISSRSIGESNLVSAKTQQNILGVVPIDVAHGFHVHYTTDHANLDTQNNHHTEILGRNIQQIDIALLNDRGQQLDLLGHHFSCILKAYY